MPLVDTSPKYVFKRGNNAQMKREILRTGKVQLEMSRSPVSREQFLHMEGEYLSEDHRERVVDEVGWGTSRKPRQVAVRRRLQSNPFVKYFFEGRLAALTSAQKREVKRSPSDYLWMRKHNPAVEFRMPKKVKEALERGAEPEQIVLLPPNNASKKVVMCLVLKGPPRAFRKTPECTPSQAHREAAQVDSVGVDLNELSRQALQFGALDADGNEVEAFPPLGALRRLTQIERWAVKLKHLDDHLATCQKRYANLPNGSKRTRVGLEIHNLHARKAGIKRAVDVQASLAMYEVAATYRPATFGIENLSSLSTRGKGGKLAKAVTWMVKRWKPIAKRLRGWIDSANLPTKIVAVNPRNTSRMHHGCGGALVRDPNHYHEVECHSCGSVVNTHQNSALNIAELARRAKPGLA